MHACRCLRRPSVSNRSATALPFFPALSCLLSSLSSLLTVALCFLQIWCFSRQRAKIFKKVCLFLGSVEALRIILSMASTFSEHSLWSIHKRCSSCVDWTKALLSLTLFKTNETEKKIEPERKSHWVSECRMSDTWRMSGRERERGRLDQQTEKRCHLEKGGGGIKGNRCTRKAFLLRIVPERELKFFFFTIDIGHCIGSPHNAAATSVRDQPWVRVHGPAGQRTVTKMSKISGYDVVHRRAAERLRRWLWRTATQACVEQCSELLSEAFLSTIRFSTEGIVNRLAGDDVTKFSNAWYRGRFVLNKDSVPNKSMLGRSLSLAEALNSFLERSERSSQLFHNLVGHIFRRYQGSPKCGAVDR